MGKGSRHLARQAAVQALYQWQLTGQKPEDIENHYVLDHDMGEIDTSYFDQLVRQIPLHVHELEDYLTPHLDWDIEEVDPVERAVLRLGVYELEFCPDVPVKVVLDEAIELAKTFGAEHGHKFINGVLDKAAATIRSGELTTKS